jgi:hypothetical protein
MMGTAHATDSIVSGKNAKIYPREKFKFAHDRKTRRGDWVTITKILQRPLASIRCLVKKSVQRISRGENRPGGNDHDNSEEQRLDNKLPLHFVRKKAPC